MTDAYAIAPNDRVAFFDKKVRKHVTRTVLAVGLGYVKVIIHGSVATIPAAEITSFEIAGQS